MVRNPDIERLLRSTDFLRPVRHVDVSRPGRIWGDHFAAQVPRAHTALSDVGLSLHPASFCGLRTLVRGQYIRDASDLVVCRSGDYCRRLRSIFPLEPSGSVNWLRAVLAGPA